MIWKQYRLIWIFIVGFWLMMPRYSVADQLILDDAKVMSFGDSLYHRGEYFRAISEYKRLMYYFPESSLVPKATLQIGRSFMAGGDYRDAVAYWEKLIDQGTAAEKDLARMRILFGISLLDSQRTKTFSLRKESVGKAIDVLSRVQGQQQEERLVQDFVHEWKGRPEPELKSPWLAGTMSAVLPGSGSFYVGRKLEGLYAFFFTSLFGMASREAFNDKRADLGIVFCLFSLAFYGGNIYTAVNSVYKYNDNLEADELLRLREKNGIWFIPESDQQQGRF